MKQLLRWRTTLLVMILVFLVIVNRTYAQESEQNIANASGYLAPLLLRFGMAKQVTATTPKSGGLIK